MTKHMLIDATHSEETRVVVMDGKRIDDYDVETSSRRQLKGNLYLAKVIRIEPSLQAAFVDYGGNRHGFLAFSEIHPDYFQIPVADRERLLSLQEEDYNSDQPPVLDAETTDSSASEHDTFNGEHDTGDEQATSRRMARFLKNYRIQEVIRRRQILLVQVVKEERGNKGAALTTYISLPGRYCVLMPNTLRGGGVSRKITSDSDRKRLRDIINHLDLPRSMSMIIRTAGAGRPGPEIVRDCDYLLQLWDDIRLQALNAVAPQLVYEEASLIKRAIRDLFTRDIEDVIVDGDLAWRQAREFTRQLMPHNANKIKAWQNRGHSLFSHYNVESHLDDMFSPSVRLESGGYLIINQTEALVAIDVNSGKSTSQRNIEETALGTNLEAAEEVARQLRLRDLAGLVVIDFIDMENPRHNAKVEKRLRDALRLDRARIQLGRISHFGLLEMSRQRLRPSLAETLLSPCPHCQGTGAVRGIDSTALHVLRLIEEEASRHRHGEIIASVAPDIALYMLNHKRDSLAETEARHQIRLFFNNDETLEGARVKLIVNMQDPSLAAEGEANLTESGIQDFETSYNAVDHKSEQKKPSSSRPSSTPSSSARTSSRKSPSQKMQIQGMTDEPVRKIEITQGEAPAPSSFSSAIVAAASDEEHYEEQAPTNRRPNRRTRGRRRSQEQDLNMPRTDNMHVDSSRSDNIRSDHTGEGNKRPAANTITEKPARTGRKATQIPAIPASMGEEEALMPGRRRTRTHRKTTTSEQAESHSSAPKYSSPPRGQGSRQRNNQEDRITQSEKPSARPKTAYTGPTPADPFAGFNILDAIEEESKPQMARHATPLSAAIEDIKEENIPPKNARRGRGRKNADKNHSADAHPASKIEQPVEQNMEQQMVTQPGTAENQAAPQPINIGTTPAPAKKRPGWWNR